MIARLVYAVIAAVASGPLAAMTEGLSLQSGKFLTPGMYVWKLLHPSPEPGFLAGMGSLMKTMVLVDSTCWFLVLCIVGLTIERSIRRNNSATQI